jgi:hypothetical protein
MASILAADVAGYSRLMGADEEGTHERLVGHLGLAVDQPAGSEYVPWYGRMGHTYLVQSRIDESILWFERGYRANPASPLHHAWLAATYALKGDVKRAAFELAQARRLSGNDRYASIARLQASGFFAVPTVRNAFRNEILLPAYARPACRRNERHRPSHSVPACGPLGGVRVGGARVGDRVGQPDGLAELGEELYDRFSAFQSSGSFFSHCPPLQPAITVAFDMDASTAVRDAGLSFGQAL